MSNNRVIDCVRCKGRGTISCPKCGDPFRIRLEPLEAQCRACNGVYEIRCPACSGRAQVLVPQIVDTSSILDLPNGRQVGDRSSEVTTARQVLAVHLLLDEANANLGNKSAEVEFIKFLIGKNKDDITVKLTEIRERGNRSDKRSKKATPRSAKSRKNDSQFIRPFLVKLKLERIINSLDDEMNDFDHDGHIT